ncbi:kelch-like protein 24 isoform X2 [Narcine bancroftii]|uniref:kelch-like protein 24 isoform X2 n=1 Tax=Narcine bancroftii TaxID=1343680 RepID=UPI003831EB3D
MQFANTIPRTDLQLEMCHAKDVLQNMSIFCQRKLFTDVVLRVERREFHCHRAILSANSIYFWTMFCTGLQESQQGIVDLKGVSADTMDCVLDHMYGGRLSIHEDNVQDLLEAADLFQMLGLRNRCEKFLEEHLDPCNCLGILSFANSFSIPALSEKSRQFLRESFTEVIQHEEFLQLPKAELLDHLSSDLLAVAREETVFESVMSWVRHDAGARKGALRELLELVRIPLLDPIYFVEKVEADELIVSSKECLPLLQEARKYHIFGSEITTPRTRPRKFADVAEVIVVVGGCDRKGWGTLPFMERYQPATGQWTQLAKTPDYSKTQFAVCILKNDIFLSGGHLYTKDVWMYNSVLNVWLRVAHLNKGRWRHKMVALQGKVQTYNQRKDEWTFSSSTPFAQRCINAVSLNDLIYVMGGLVECIYQYDPRQDLWSILTRTPGPLENSGLTVCNGMLYILGGKDALAEGTDQVLCVDPTSSNLSHVSNMPRCVSYHGCVTIHQRVK